MPGNVWLRDGLLLGQLVHRDRLFSQFVEDEQPGRVRQDRTQFGVQLSDFLGEIDVVH